MAISAPEPRIGSNIAPLSACRAEIHRRQLENRRRSVDRRARVQPPLSGRHTLSIGPNSPPAPARRCPDSDRNSPRVTVLEPLASLAIDRRRRGSGSGGAGGSGAGILARFASAIQVAHASSPMRRGVELRVALPESPSTLRVISGAGTPASFLLVLTEAPYPAASACQRAAARDQPRHRCQSKRSGALSRPDCLTQPAASVRHAEPASVARHGRGVERGESVRDLEPAPHAMVCPEPVHETSQCTVGAVDHSRQPDGARRIDRERRRGPCVDALPRGPVAVVSGAAVGMPSTRTTWRRDAVGVARSPSRHARPRGLTRGLHAPARGL